MKKLLIATVCLLIHLLLSSQFPGELNGGIVESNLSYKFIKSNSYIFHWLWFREQ